MPLQLNTVVEPPKWTKTLQNTKVFLVSTVSSSFCRWLPVIPQVAHHSQNDLNWIRKCIEHWNPYNPNQQRSCTLLNYSFVCCWFGFSVWVSGVYTFYIYVCVCPARRLMLCCVALPSFHRSCHRSHRSCHRFKSILVTFVFNCCGMDCNWKDKNWNLVTILCTPNSAYLYMECMYTLYMFVSLKHPFILLLGTRPSQGKWFPA